MTIRNPVSDRWSAYIADGDVMCVCVCVSVRYIIKNVLCRDVELTHTVEHKIGLMP